MASDSYGNVFAVGYYISNQTSSPTLKKLSLNKKFGVVASGTFACYWENGDLNTLCTNALNSIAYSIALDNHDNVYSAGEYDSDYCYWTNDVLETLGSSSISGINTIALDSFQ